MARLPKLMLLAMSAIGLAAAATPWRVPRATVADALRGWPEGDGAMRAVVAGPVTFKLLPRPRIQATQLSVSAGNGAIALDAPALKAELDIPSLLRGTWRMSSATLVEPTVTVDLDRLAARPPIPTAAGRAPGRLRLRSGLVQTRSTAGFGDQLATGVDADVGWSGGGEDVALSGIATWRGTRAQFAGALRRPPPVSASAGTPASFAVTSPLFALSVDGTLSRGADGRFAGRASLTTASLPELVRKLDGPLAPASKRAQIGGNLLATPHELSLSNARLRLDGAQFEGALAWRRDAGRSLLAGTLATDLLDIDALVGGGPDAAGLETLFAHPLAASPFGVDLDIRVSATVARLGRVTLDDAAMAALVRGDRLDVALDEARVYGGLVKARAVATIGPDGVDAHGEVSTKRVDLGLLSEGLGGRASVGGALSAHAAVDGRGASFRDVVAALSGDGQIGVEGGRFSGLSLAQVLRRLGQRVPLDADRRGTPTTFDKALWDVSIRGGTVAIPAGRLTAPGVALAFGAETDLPDGRVTLHAVAAQTDPSGAPLRDGQSMPFDMRGFWAGPLTLIGRGAGLPALTLPLIDGFAAAR